ncbi:hypothetical protein RF11_15898 [Thelohanellus kitauei]|uniref:DDE-1 domain-containing protein n=1 Tax=Thelohanellus kitauei TaxID=669202 RepID=A0A0C2I5C8_THEKT|nr:hypothetical protein RF11_15898 [Thelohanellus kitauei]
MTDFALLTVRFLPRNTISLIQPIDHDCISVIKNCTLARFSVCGLNIKKFWKENFDIIEDIHIKAWSEVRQRQLISPWQELGVQVDTLEIIGEILTTARNLKSEFKEDSIEELIIDHHYGMTTEELKQNLE